MFALPIDPPKSAPVPFQVLANRPENIRRGSGEGVGFGQDARGGMLRGTALLVAPALGDVFAGDQDNRIITSPPHGLSIFTNPDDPAVLADFSDLPVMRAAEFLYTDRQLSFNELPVLLEKDVQHGLSNQLGGGKAELSGAKAVHRQHRPDWTDDEIHHRVVFEDLPPLLLALSQRVLGALTIKGEKSC